MQATTGLTFVADQRARELQSRGFFFVFPTIPLEHLVGSYVMALPPRSTVVLGSEQRYAATSVASAKIPRRPATRKSGIGRRPDALARLSAAVVGKPRRRASFVVGTSVPYVLAIQDALCTDSSLLVVAGMLSAALLPEELPSSTTKFSDVHYELFLR